MKRQPFEEQVSGVAALDHPLRRQTFRLVLDSGWVGRDAAAQALGVPRSVAAFHLDKLVDAGLLEARYERAAGRTGPGAGRPAKLYGRSAQEIDLSLPPRRYDLAGSVLAEAVSRAAADVAPVDRAVTEVAREEGERIGSVARASRSGSAAPAALVDALTQNGYEPREKEVGEITLLNCPFHSLAEQHRHLVCGMNLELLSGVVQGAGAGSQFRARLAPAPGYCCVRLERIDQQPPTDV